MKKKIIRLTESDLHAIIKESVKKVLREVWYPENDDDVSDYSYGSIMRMEIGGNLDEMDESVMSALHQVHDEYIESESSYLSVMVRGVDITRDENGFLLFVVEVAVSAPNMPESEIYSDAKEQVWLWFENKTGERITNVSIIDEKPVFDRR